MKLQTRERKYARVDRNLGSLDLEPEPSVRFVTNFSRTNDGTRPVLRICS